MNWLLGGIQKLCGVLFAVVGFFVGVTGVCLAGTYACLVLKGDHLSPHDRTLWLVFSGAGLGGLLLYWLGACLLRNYGAGHKAFRLTMTGPQRRQTANRAFGGTMVWLGLSAECLCFCSHGSLLARVGEVAAGVAAIYLGLHALTLIHELGHLGVAALLGLDLQEMQIGTGPRFLKVRLGELRIEWRAWLGGGLVRTADLQERGWRWRHWVYVAGGPAASALACLALAAWIQARTGGNWTFGQAQGIIGGVLLFLLYLKTYIWLFSVLPRRALIGAVRARTDGWQLLHAPHFSRETVQAIIFTTVFRRVEILWDEGRREAAWERFRQFSLLYPDAPGLLAVEGYLLGLQGDHLAAAAKYQSRLHDRSLVAPVRRQLLEHCFIALAKAEKPEEARRFCADALQNGPSESRPALLDAFATAVLAHKLSAFLPDADAWSQELLALEPTAVTRKGTRGSVLVEQGHSDEGAALLREVWATSPSELDAGISTFYLGLAAKQRGQPREVRRWRTRAKSFAPFAGKWLEERIARELTPAAPATAAA